MVCVVLGIVILCVVNQRRGHDWGDDFSLYLRQGTSIVDGNVQRVLDDNRFTIDQSSWHTFSPYAYPWGWPILIAPIYASWGIDYEILKIVEALLFGVFLLCWNSVLVRRVGARVALLLVLAIGFSVAYVGWTDTALSEFPYLAFLGLTWWWFDRCRDRRAFAEGPLWPLAVLGLLVAYTYDIRREGLALVAALGLHHTVELVRSVRHHRSLGRALRATPWARVAAPYVSGAVFVLAVNVVLPAPLFQRYPEAGPKQLKPNAIWFRDILAENIGLKDAGVARWDLLGSDGLAKFVFTVFVVLSVIGLVACIVRRAGDDAPLIGYGVGVCLIVGMQPFHEGRYLMSVTPLMLYFAAQAILLPAAGSARRPHLGPIAAGLFVGIFVVTNATDLFRRTVDRIDTGNYTLWGPEDPAALEMFGAVRQFVPEDGIVSFFRARAMNLYAERRAVQLTTVEDLDTGADYYVMERNSTYSQVLLSDEDAAAYGFVKVWENTHFVLWRL